MIGLELFLGHFDESPSKLASELCYVRMEGVVDIDNKQLTSNNIQCINKNPLTTIVMQLKLIKKMKFPTNSIISQFSYKNLLKVHNFNAYIITNHTKNRIN